MEEEKKDTQKPKLISLVVRFWNYVISSLFRKTKIALIDSSMLGIKDFEIEIRNKGLILAFPSLVTEELKGIIASTKKNDLKKNAQRLLDLAVEQESMVLRSPEKEKLEGWRDVDNDAAIILTAIDNMDKYNLTLYTADKFLAIRAKSFNLKYKYFKFNEPEVVEVVSEKVISKVVIPKKVKQEVNKPKEKVKPQISISQSKPVLEENLAQVHKALVNEIVPVLETKQPEIITESLQEAESVIKVEKEEVVTEPVEQVELKKSVYKEEDPNKYKFINSGYFLSVNFLDLCSFIPIKKTHGEHHLETSKDFPHYVVTDEKGNIKKPVGHVHVVSKGSLVFKIHPHKVEKYEIVQLSGDENAKCLVEGEFINEIRHINALNVKSLVRSLVKE